MSVFLLKEESELETVVDAVLAVAKPQPDQATVLALRGELGSGKTTFTQYLGRRLGVTSKIVSPTFVVMKHYPLPPDRGAGFVDLYHLDAYRIESIDEVRPLKLEELKTTPHTLVVIEWPERISEVLNLPHIELCFKITDGCRALTLANLPYAGYGN